MGWFLVKIKTCYQNEQGKQTVSEESYLLDAISYTEAEARAYEHFAKIHQEFQVSRIQPVIFHDIFPQVPGSPEIRWYKAKVHYILFDERTQKEKLVPYNFMVQAETLLEAHNHLDAVLGKMQDYTITSIAKTNIEEVLPYESHLEETKEPAQ